MKKGLYILYDELDDKGVNKKIKGQIESFKKHGYIMEQYLMGGNLIRGYQLWARLPFTNLVPKWVRIPNIEKYDFIYLRKPGFMSGAFLKFLRAVKKENPSVLIFMEIPTYPYDKEYVVNRKDIPYLMKDKFARKKIGRYIDYIPLLVDEAKVFGVNTVKIINGYDFETLPARGNCESTEIIDIAIVARFQFWHGYERLIEGLYEYYKNGGQRKVVLHFVGDGQVVDDYKKKIMEYGLDNNARFYGFLDNSEIMSVYNKCNLSVDALAGYRKDVYLSCSLKTREYLAVGLPIVTGIRLDIQEYEELRPYVLEFENSPAALSVEKIVDYYDSMYGGNSSEDNREMINNIRESSRKYLDSNNALNNVISIIDAAR
ncbi:hypothetical protein C806_01822 [Lachnospiraceae bacterium 3-1]|nr:hypothetical protein C806_01822 [Lachnospiraceae bacterium 3-1]